MALPTSGALTLDAIHVEAGGTTGTTCSLNDTDIRGLAPGSGKTINSTQGTTVDFDDFYGASSGNSLSMTVGHSVVTTSDQYTTTTTSRRGFVANSFGSISPTSFSGVMGGATITNCLVFGSTISTTATLQLASFLVGSSIPNTNSSFTSMTVDGSTVQRSNATYTSSQVSTTHFAVWTWQGSPVASSVNLNASGAGDYDPFPASGNTITVTFQ